MRPVRRDPLLCKSTGSRSPSTIPGGRHGPSYQELAPADQLSRVFTESALLPVSHRRTGTERPKVGFASPSSRELGRMVRKKNWEARSRNLWKSTSQLKTSMICRSGSSMIGSN